MIASLHLPMAMGIQGPSKTWRPDPIDLGCSAEDEARRAGMSLTKFLDRAVAAFLHFAPLDPENREYITEIQKHLGRPWSRWDVVNRIISNVRARKMRLSFVGSQRSIQRATPLFDQE